MKRMLGQLVVVLVLTGSVCAGGLTDKTLLNRIVGEVYDPEHRPLDNINVELYNEVDSLLGRTKTNSGGVFTFLGVSRGTFEIRVLPFGTGLVGASKRVDVTP